LRDDWKVEKRFNAEFHGEKSTEFTEKRSIKRKGGGPGLTMPNVENT